MRNVMIFNNGRGRRLNDFCFLKSVDFLEDFSENFACKRSLKREGFQVNFYFEKCFQRKH